MRILALPMAKEIAARAQGEIPDQVARKPLVLTVSRLAAEHRYKGHFDIARCFSRVLERRPDATWIVVGDGDDLPALRAECERLGIHEAVYRRAALFALPSFADIDAKPPVGEGFGLVYLEAGAFGLPSIAATPGGGSADFVSHGQTGLTVRPHAADELAEAILRLLEDPQLRAALGRRARSQAFARHLPEHFRQALHESLG
jgi:phosphatidylinositol alpha-1,6-mannosyltransferase